MERKKVNSIVQSFSGLDEVDQKDVAKKFSTVFEAPVETVSRALRDLGHMAEEISDFKLVPFGKGKRRGCIQVSGEGIAFRVRLGKNSFQLTFSHDGEEEEIV